jgi:hypothetical protein
MLLEEDTLTSLITGASQRMKEKSRLYTVKENYQNILDGFNIADLPTTFQDAVQVARAIGQSFLWIDTICITQEDEDDWSKAYVLSLSKSFRMVD